MKQKIIFTTIFALVLSSQLVTAGSITDSYTTGDSLTATKMNNIKSAVNDNDFDISTNTENIAINSSDIAENALRLPAMKSLLIFETVVTDSGITTNYFQEPLVVQPQTQGYLFIQAQAQVNCLSNVRTQSKYGIYISTSSTPPTNLTEFTYFEVHGYAFILDAIGNGGNHNTRIMHPYPVQAGVQYYIWYGVNEVNTTSPFCQVIDPRITASLFQFGL